MILQEHFKIFKENIIGNDLEITTPFGKRKLIYADWIASGRLYKQIEDELTNFFGPYLGNTHSETSLTGAVMTIAYHESHEFIKKHCNASKDDVIITAGSGMTAVVNKFQRILGLKVPEQIKDYINFPEELKPIVFVTHMEHHSNQTSWLETIADVECILPDEKGLICLEHLDFLLNKYKDRQLKIGAFTACSNVTGIETPYHQMAKMMHKHGGYCFIDFACSAPYVDINMHPDDPDEKLDAIFFSPHKFLGGPGTPGVLIFDSALYKNQVPDQPGGGTVDWTNPWGQHKFISNIEAREDGGTPPFMQTIKAALAIKLKNKMSTSLIHKREEELVKRAFSEFEKIPTVHLLASEVKERLGVISFYVEDMHYNLVVQLLNDLFGVQVRGGCSCAGTYGHFLLHVDKTRSQYITDKINSGDLSEKPGWVRLSLHPTMTNEELQSIIQGIKYITEQKDQLSKLYNYNPYKNEFKHKDYNFEIENYIKKLF